MADTALVTDRSPRQDRELAPAPQPDTDDRKITVRFPYTERDGILYDGLWVAET